MNKWHLRSIAKRLRLAAAYDFVGTLKSPFRGVYDNWEEAARALPKGSKEGYNHPELASMYLNFTERIRLSDYPVLFWLRSIISSSASVFDLGGNVGLEYYAFQKYLQYPPQLRWIVCDVPHIAQYGRELAEKRCARYLEFTSDFQRADGADILLTAGSLQCIEDSLDSILSGLARKPRYLLINRIPLYDGPAYYTLRALPPTMLIYKVFNRTQFIKTLQSLGYELIDQWPISEASCGKCAIPGRPDKSIESYTGMFLSLT